MAFQNTNTGSNLPQQQYHHYTMPTTRIPAPTPTSTRDTNNVGHDAGAFGGGGAQPPQYINTFSAAAERMAVTKQFHPFHYNRQQQQQPEQMTYRRPGIPPPVPLHERGLGGAAAPFPSFSGTSHSHHDHHHDHHHRDPLLDLELDAESGGGAQGGDHRRQNSAGGGAALLVRQQVVQPQHAKSAATASSSNFPPLSALNVNLGGFRQYQPPMPPSRGGAAGGSGGGGSSSSTNSGNNSIVHRSTSRTNSDNTTSSVASSTVVGGAVLRHQAPHLSSARAAIAPNGSSADQKAAAPSSMLLHHHHKKQKPQPVQQPSRALNERELSPPSSEHLNGILVKLWTTIHEVHPHLFSKDVQSYREAQLKCYHGELLPSFPAFFGSPGGNDHNDEEEQELDVVPTPAQMHRVSSGGNWRKRDRDHEDETAAAGGGANAPSNLISTTSSPSNISKMFCGLGNFGGNKKMKNSSKGSSGAAAAFSGGGGAGGPAQRKTSNDPVWTKNVIATPTLLGGGSSGAPQQRGTSSSSSMQFPVEKCVRLALQPRNFYEPGCVLMAFYYLHKLGVATRGEGGGGGGGVKNSPSHHHITFFAQHPWVYFTLFLAIAHKYHGDALYSFSFFLRSFVPEKLLGNGGGSEALPPPTTDYVKRRFMPLLLEDLKRMEFEVMMKLDFNLFIDTKEFQHWLGATCGEGDAAFLQRAMPLTHPIVANTERNNSQASPIQQQGSPASSTSSASSPVPSSQMSMPTSNKSSPFGGVGSNSSSTSAGTPPPRAENTSNNEGLPFHHSNLPPRNYSRGSSGSGFPATLSQLGGHQSRHQNCCAASTTTLSHDRHAAATHHTSSSRSGSGGGGAGGGAATLRVGQIPSSSTSSGAEAAALAGGVAGHRHNVDG